MVEDVVVGVGFVVTAASTRDAMAMMSVVKEKDATIQGV